MLTALGICVALNGATADPTSLINQIRREHGLPRVQPHDALQRAATAHVRYMLANSTAGHGQRPGEQGFVGKTPGERARYFGYVGANSEAVAWGDFGMTETVQGLFDAPYHRVLFLQPKAPDFGAAFSNGVLCVKFGGPTGDGRVVSPPNSARRVPTSWDGMETPDPLRRTNLRGPVGYPIVLALFGREVVSFRFIGAELKSGAGSVPTIALHPGSDKDAEGAIILIPRSPLTGRTTYTATFNFRNSTGEHTVRTTFSTGG